VQFFVVSYRIVSYMKNSAARWNDWAWRFRRCISRTSLRHTDLCQAFFTFEVS